jgi:hypothetical protein
MQQRRKEKKYGMGDRGVQGIRFLTFLMGNHVRKGRAVLTGCSVGRSDARMIRWIWGDFK